MHPVLFSAGPFTIYTYGFFTAIGFLAAYGLTKYLARKGNVPSEPINDLVFFAFVLGILGARVWYVLQHPDEFENVWQILWLQEGGLVWYGGFIFAVLGGVLLARFKGWPALPLLDIFAPAIALGQALGRVGCYFNGCCYGKHGIPVQLYEAAALVALTVFLCHLWMKRHKDGAIFSFYLISYSTLRFFIEFLRGDQAHFYSLTLPQWTSVFFVFAGIIFLLRLKEPHGRI